MSTLCSLSQSSSPRFAHPEKERLLLIIESSMHVMGLFDIAVHVYSLSACNLCDAAISCSRCCRITGALLVSCYPLPMPPAQRRTGRSCSRGIPAARLGADIRAALLRGAIAVPSLADLSPEQEVAISEWPLADLVATKAAWADNAAASTSLLLIANLQLLPDGFRAAFALPSPQETIAETSLLTTRIQSLLRLAMQFHCEQRSALEPFAGGQSG